MSRSRKKKLLLDFWNGPPRLTDFSKEAFSAVLPIIHERLPRIKHILTDDDICCALNAIAYVAVFNVSWNKVENVKVVQRFYYRLKKLGLLSILRARAGLPASLLVNRMQPKQPQDDRPRRARRPCGVCPKCGADAMRCYGSHKTGALRIRHYRCNECKYASVWITGASRSWWKKPREIILLAKKFPTCG